MFVLVRNHEFVGSVRLLSGRQAVMTREAIKPRESRGGRGKREDSGLTEFGDSDFFDATLVSSAFEIGGEECLEDFEGEVGRDEACRERQDVGVVVLACECGEFGVPADCCPTALVFVDCHTDAVCAAADCNSELDSSLLDGVCQRVGVVGIVAAFGTVCSEVFDDVALLFEEILDCFFQFVAGVVGCDADVDKVKWLHNSE